MKNFLKQHGLWILFAAAVIAVSLALLSFFSSTSSPLTNLAGVVTSPFRSAYTAVATWFNDKQAYYKEYNSLEEENRELKKQIAEMEDAVRQAQSYKAENAQFRKLLNLQEQTRTLNLATAKVTEHSPSNWTSSLTLNKGTNSGVAVNNCVITEDHYLVGVVTDVGLNWCTVLTVLDTDTSLGAKVFRTGDIGVAQGDFALMNDGELKLSYLPTGCDLINGDLIVTSGSGGYFPSDLVIGKVDEVKPDDSGSTQYAVLSPSAQIDNLSEVFIITSFDYAD